jgi:hypothetical protein
MHAVRVSAVAFVYAAALFALASACTFAAERPLYTIVDGDARVLRGTTWHRLEAGAQVDSGDVVEAAERAEVQVELPAGEIVRIAGPALAHVAVLAIIRGKHLTSEFTLLRGWFKLAANEKAPALALTLPNAALALGDGVVVVHADARAAQVFVESGRASIAALPGRGRFAGRKLIEGDYWERADERAPQAGEGAPHAFVTAMPVQLRDPLPALAQRFDGPPPTLVAGRRLDAAEAAPWLAGPTRAAFVRRFGAVSRHPAHDPDSKERPQ